MRSFRERRAWLVGVITIALLASGVAFAFSINRFQAFRGVYGLSLELEDAAGVQPGNEVRLAGVRVGQVVGVELDPHAARVEIEVTRGTRLPAETRAEVKLKTLLGQKFVDLLLPGNYLRAAAGGGDPGGATSGYLRAGDVIPVSQTKIPFEIHQAATEGTAVLEEIDKEALRDLLAVLGRTVGASKDELGEALGALDRAGEVLGGKSREITDLLANLETVSGTLAESDEDIEALLARGAEVLEVLAARRVTISSLLAATTDFGENFGLLIQAIRGSVHAGTQDLSSILAVAEAELDAIGAALAELGASQELFGRPLTFGRFTEGHVCPVTSADSCIPHGSPESPGIPVSGVDPHVPHSFQGPR
jgi:phospholipid/cholesterol/gamma-HCH transport system substrate-binding protein